MEAVAARLFGDGLPGGGLPVAVRWQGDRLRLDGQGLAWTAGVTAIAAAGFDDTDLRCELGAPRAASAESAEPGDGAYALFVPAAGIRDFSAGAPEGLKPSLAKAGRSSRTLAARFRLAWLTAVVVALAGVLGATWLVLRSDALAGWAVEHIPLEQEVALGDLVLAQTRASMTLHDSGPAVDAVRAIGDRLTVGSRYRYRWFVADREDLNAFAAPGGVVVVFSGLIRGTDSAEQLAGVLAHEVAHAELRHGLRAIVKGFGVRAVTAALFGDFGGGLLGDAAAQLTELKFSRDAERQADADGLRRLVNAEIDPQGMPAFFAKLAKAQDGGPPTLLSTHPDSDERRQALERAIAELPRRDWEPLASEWPPAGLPPLPPRKPASQPLPGADRSS